MPSEIETIKARILNKLIKDLPKKNLIIRHDNIHSHVIVNKRIFDTKQKVIQHITKNLPAKNLLVER